MIRRAAALLLAGLALLARAGDEQPPEFIHAAFVETAFTSMNRNDSIAAVTVWAEQLLKNRGLKCKSHVQLYPTADDLAVAIREERADIVAVSAVDYLRLRDKAELDPLFLGTKRGSTLDHYQVLVRKDDPATGVADLRGETVLLHTGGHMSLGREWFQTLLPADAAAAPPVTFGETEKILGAVMPVFLHQRRAALVAHSIFESAAELNPQLSRDLRPLAESAPMASAVVCLRHGYTYRRADVADELARLGETPRGQQILTLLRYESLAPFKPEVLDTTIALMRESAARHDQGSPSP